MKNTQYVDNLIIGGGLSGIWLSHAFYVRNKSFAIYDVSSHNHSSRVAAGLYNPLLPKRQKLAFKANEIYPDLGKKYHELETLLHKRFCHHHPSLYIIESAAELNDWAALSESDRFSKFVSIGNDRLSDAIVSDFGYLEIQHSGWVDIPLLLDAYTEWITSPNIYRHETFEASELHHDGNTFIYKDLSCKNVVFCQGTAINENPITAAIQLKPAKGEILLIESDELLAGLVPQNGVFMLPVDHGKFRVGSNFTWEDLNTTATESAKEEIVQKFTRWYKQPFDIVAQVAGIRPSSLDRRPFLGPIPSHPDAFVFNGLGSKGVTLAPYYAEMLASHIYDGTPIDNEVHVKRFLRKKS